MEKLSDHNLCSANQAFIEAEIEVYGRSKDLGKKWDKHKNHDLLLLAAASNHTPAAMVTEAVLAVLERLAVLL